jgi:hypothetical protein
MPGQPGLPGQPGMPGAPAQPGLNAGVPAAPNPLLQPGPGPTPMDPNLAPQATPETQQLAALLVGEWEGTAMQQGTPNAVMQRIRLVVTADGRFQQTLVEFTGSTFIFWGTYVLTAMGPTYGVINVNPQGWQPQQICYGQYNCSPVTLNQSVVQFAFLDRSTLTTSAGGANARFTRVR